MREESTVLDRKNNHLFVKFIIAPLSINLIPQIHFLLIIKLNIFIRALYLSESMLNSVDTRYVMVWTQAVLIFNPFRPVLFEGSESGNFVNFNKIILFMHFTCLSINHAHFLLFAWVLICVIDLFSCFVFYIIHAVMFRLTPDLTWRILPTHLNARLGRQ